MNFLNKSNVSILDLPDEMLRAIINKLNMIDVQYSLVDVNLRFDRLVFDSLYIHNLDFEMKRDYIHNQPKGTYFLDRICNKVLPRINTKILKLTLEPLSMERVIGAVDYPNLYSLSLVNYHQPETLLEHLTSTVINLISFYESLTFFISISDDVMSRLLTNQITHIKVEISERKQTICIIKSSIFFSIVCLSKCLTDLTYFHRCLEDYIKLSYSNMSYTGCLSSTLYKSMIYVKTFNHCLYLLNGCLPSLSTLIICINKIISSSSNIVNTVIKLKYFSLKTNWYTYGYDTQVVPLLNRMLNLEELTLYISVVRTESTYIDGNQLYDEVLNNMSQLKKFIFNIHTHIINYRNEI
ncbi:unnamed protein product, partial [Rotaria sp. Silwood2]